MFSSAFKGINYDDEILIEEIVNKVILYEEYRKEILKSLNDTEDEFMSYIDILRSSGVDIFENQFLKDMVDVIFFNKRIGKVYIKYKNQNIEIIKLKILNEIIKKSKESIVSAITNPLENKIEYIEYKVGDRKVLIPTVTYNKEPYNFFVRRISLRYDKNYNSEENRVEYCSIITEKNKSMYYGDSGIKVGYIEIKPEALQIINI